MPLRPSISTKQFNLRGVEEIIARLDKLPSEVADRVMGTALRAGAQIVADEMKITAHRQQTRDAIAVKKTPISQSPLKIEYRVGPDNSDFIALFEEFGTAERFHRSGKPTGRHPIRPFARPAFERSKGRAEDRVIKVASRGLDNAVRRLRRGQ